MLSWSRSYIGVPREPEEHFLHFMLPLATALVTWSLYYVHDSHIRTDAELSKPQRQAPHHSVTEIGMTNFLKISRSDEVTKVARTPTLWLPSSSSFSPSPSPPPRSIPLLLPPPPHLRAPRCLQIHIPKWQPTNVLRAHAQPLPPPHKHAAHVNANAVVTGKKLPLRCSQDCLSGGEVALDVLGVVGVLLFAFFAFGYDAVAEHCAAEAAVGRRCARWCGCHGEKKRLLAGNGIGALPESEDGFVDDNMTDVKDTSTTYSKLDFDEFSPSSFATTAYRYDVRHRLRLPAYTSLLSTNSI
ncbi:hypothetical protein C8R45DRAFT_1184933 [Mycena sanguinolenta]|nr:hypothetical protein C8R45DRAFT_1184933 [Mycena sanguinolenta]